MPGKGQRGTYSSSQSNSSSSMNPTAGQCTKAELELFTTPPINVSMERGDVTIHRPLATLSDHAPIEFVVPGSVEEYVDLGRTQLYLKVKLIQAGGDALASGAKVSTANLLLHSVFSQVDVKLNERLVTPSVNTYPYKAFMETLLSHGPASKQSWLKGEFYYEDKKPLNSHDPTAAASNEGLKKRGLLLAESKPVELMGRPHVDIFMQDRYLVNGVDMSLKLTRANSAFYLMGEAVGDFRLTIMDAALHVRKVKINPTISLQHAKMMNAGHPAKYPLRRGVVTTFTVGTGSLSFNKENIVTGQLPRRVVLALVTNTSFNGSGKENPFFFGNYDLNYVSLSTGTQNFPSQPLKPNYDEGEYMTAFNNLYQATGTLNSTQGLAISPDTFANGHTLYAFDLTADMCEGAHIDPIKYGALRMEAHFATATLAPLNVLVYSEFDNLMQVDRARNVITDFPAS